MTTEQVPSKERIQALYSRFTTNVLIFTRAHTSELFRIIEGLQRELDGANKTIAHFMGPEGEKYIDRFTAMLSGPVSLEESIRKYSASEPPAEHPDPYKRCQHDLLKPGTTIEVIDAWKAKCVVCIEFFDLPGRPSQPPGDDAARLNWWFMNVLHVGGDDDDDESGSDIEYEARLCRTPDEFRAMIDAAMGRTPTKGDSHES